MQTLLEFAVTDCIISSLDTCLLLQTNNIQTLDKKQLTLAVGEVLDVGDKFTGIDEAGCAAKPPLTITNGWYQQYEGSIFISSESAGWLSNNDRRVLLFSGTEIETGEYGLDRLHSSYEHTYMAYISMEDGSMLYWNSCGSSRIIKCQSIARININKEHVLLAA